MLVAAPVSAAPSDYAFDVQEIGPQQSHITVRLRNLRGNGNGGPPVDLDGAICILGQVPQDGLCTTAKLGPKNASSPTMDGFNVVARPGNGKGRYTIIIEPGMQVFELFISANVPGETDPVTQVIPLSP